MNKKTDMKVKPLKSYKIPGYPGKEFYSTDPYKLLSDVPGNWLKTPVTVGALLAFVFSMSAPAATDESLLPSTPNQANQAKVADKTIPTTDSSIDDQQPEHKQETVAIAPLFIHGAGSGAVGCVVISPPAFLPEEEAIEIILSQLKQEGFQFEKRDYILPEVFTKEVTTTWGEYRQRNLIELDIKHPFYFDLYDEQYNIGIKFISEVNYFNLGGPDCSSSVQDYEMIDLAQSVREKLRDYNKTNAAVFYDPLVKYKDEYPGKSYKDCLKEGGQELRNQVTDFIRWWKDKTIAKEESR